MSFLTQNELYHLMKRKQGAAQIRVLRRQGIAFKLDGNGHPVVTWESVNAHSGRIPKRREIDREAWNALMDRYRKATKNKARTRPNGVTTRSR